MFYDLENKKIKNLGENWVAPNAVIIGDVTLEKNVSIWFNVTLRGDIENIYVGEGSNVQDGSVLHTDPGCPLKIEKWSLDNIFRMFIATSAISFRIY